MLSLVLLQQLTSKRRSLWHITEFASHFALHLICPCLPPGPPG